MNQATQKRPEGFVDFKEVKTKVSLTEVLERYQVLDNLSRNGDRLSGPCPIHGGSNVTQFRVSISKNCFNCFGSCEGGGNVIDFVSRMENVSFRDAALLLQSWFLPEPAHEKNASRSICRKSPSKQNENRSRKIISFQNESISSEIDSQENIPLTFKLKTLDFDHPYLASRGLSPEAIAHFGLGYCKRGCLRGHVVVPIHNPDGALVAYAGRWPGQPDRSHPKYRFPKGFRKSLEVYNLHRALEEPDDLPLVLVEGFFDCIKMWQAGVRKCVALMGSHCSETQIDRIIESLPSNSEVEVLFDADDAGRKGADRVAESLKDHSRIRIIELPKNGMQPDHLSSDQVAELFE